MEVEISMKSSNKKPSHPLERRPSLLKDFLRDDMSSCSSNGFRSFPRRSCYTSIRNLLEIDLKTRDNLNSTIKHNTTGKQQLQRSRSRAAAATTTISAFQKASDVVINVVKHLTFSSVKSPVSSSSSKQGILILPRSFSRRLRKSFWRKSGSTTNSHDHKVVEREMNAAIKVKDIMRWRSFRDLLEEKTKQLDSSSPIHTIITATTTTSSNTTTTTISWSDSDFTSESLHSSSRSSESSGENEEDVVVEQCKTYLPTEKKKKKKKKCSIERNVGEEDSNSIQEKGEALMYEKDRFSPVSVLDFPSEEDEEEGSSSSSSSFLSSLATMEKKKHKLMQKIRRFESLTQLEPVNLDNRISSFEIDDHDSLQSPCESYSVSVGDNIIEEYDEEEEENIEAEEKARKLLDLVKEKSFESNEDILLIDFFRDEILERNLIKRLAKGDDDRFDHGLLNVARDWLNGYCEQLDWGLEESRKVHVREMERGGKWKNSDHEEEQGELALEMEVMVFDSLMDDLLLDLSS